MKKKLLTLLVIAICLSTSVAFGQSKRLKVEIENISIKAPENWLVEKTDKEMSGFKILLYNQENKNHVTIECIKKAMNLEAAIVDASSEKSLKQGFEYMIIEKVKSSTLNKYQAKFLEYTNSPLRDYYRGGFYGIIDNGYTYIIDYYSDDTPEGRNVVEKIINSINILKPESRPNFFEVEKEYLPENVKIETKEKTFIEESEVKEQKVQQNEVNEQTTIKDTPKKEKKSVWKKMTSIFDKKKEKEEINTKEEKSKNIRPNSIGKTKTKYQNQAKKTNVSNKEGKSLASSPEKIPKVSNQEKTKPTNIYNKTLTDKPRTIAEINESQTIKKEKPKETNIDNKTLADKPKTIAEISESQTIKKEKPKESRQSIKQDKPKENQLIKQDKPKKEEEIKEKESFWLRLATTLMGEKVEEVKPNKIEPKKENIINSKLQDKNQTQNKEEVKEKESFWSRLATALMGEKIDTTKKPKTR
jgi:hypothetical protein